KPQDHCSTEVPEGSGNTNPTASTRNPPADHMETLTVETPIPIVSLPVSTAYSTDSQDSSSDARLILKRVANPEETPSLDNILSLTNRVRPIGTNWVLKNKKDERGIVIRNKARLVAQGNTQEEGIDYDEVFAPIARIKAIRLFLAYASFMGFTDPEFLAKVYKVEKAMYGLHQAPRAWYGTLSKYLLKNGFQRLCREFKALMHEKFQMSAMGELNFFLGLDFLEKKLISMDHIPIDENVADLLTKPFDAGRFQYLVVEHAMRGFIKGNIIIYTLFVSHIVFGWVIGTSKFWGVLRILMISLRLILLGEFNVDFHPMVDFIKASPLRIETTNEGTYILATVDGITKTVTESSLRRNLKPQDEEGISSLPEMELFENLTLMGYKISPNQKFTFQKGEFSHQWKYLIHTIIQCISPKSIGFNEFSSNIGTALVCLV
nr:hypothetical protein [Tanacetum cinerariifolium]